MIESEIVAQGSINGVLTGKHYNRCIRAHKIVYVDVSQDPRVDTVYKLYKEYTRNAAESNVLFSFWSIYIELIQMLMSFIRATRESNWALHLSTLKSMLPWFFATDRINYSRYASCYWLEMNCLESTHPCRYLYTLFCYCATFLQKVFAVLTVWKLTSFVEPEIFWVT